MAERRQVIRDGLELITRFCLLFADLLNADKFSKDSVSKEELEQIDNFRREFLVVKKQLEACSPRRENAPEENNDLIEILDTFFTATRVVLQGEGRSYREKLEAEAGEYPDYVRQIYEELKEGQKLYVDSARVFLSPPYAGRR